MIKVDGEPAFVLHRRAFRETSLTVELLSAGHGRVAGVARGARGPRSALRAFGQPFTPLEVSWVRRGEMATLTGAEPLGKAPTLLGRALWCALYANELVLRLMPRDDADPGIFSAYSSLLPMLPHADRQADALRAFELELLTGLGVAPDLTACTATGQSIDPDGWYRVDPVLGPEPTAPGRGTPGRVLLGLAGRRPLPPDDAAAARRVMRQLIDHQLDGRPLETPRLFRE